MVDTSRQNNAKPEPVLDCSQWEVLLAEEIDGTLALEVEASFAEHGRSCRSCAGLLEQAHRGQQWLRLLAKNAPATPSDLLPRILAQTEARAPQLLGTALQSPQAGGWTMPLLAHASAADRSHNARLLMTAAMAFFSVALTLSMAGVRLTSVHAAELRPQAVGASVTRSFYGTKKQVVSFYDNLRLVYEVESRMHEMRREAEPAPAPPQATPGREPAPEKNKPPTGRPGASGSSHASGFDSSDSLPAPSTLVMLEEKFVSLGQAESGDRTYLEGARNRFSPGREFMRRLPSSSTLILSGLHRTGKV